MEDLISAKAIKGLGSMVTLKKKQTPQTSKIIFSELDLTSTSHCSTIGTSGEATYTERMITQLFSQGKTLLYPGVVLQE